MLLADDDGGAAWATGDGASICISDVAREDVLLVERDEDERVNVPFNLRIILQKLTIQQNLWNRLRK